MLRVIKGQVRLEMHCAPRFNYRGSSHHAQTDQGSIWFIPDCPDCPSMALHATFPLHVDGADATASFTLNAGETAKIAFGEVDEEEKTRAAVLDPRKVEEHFEETSRFWRAWISRSKYTGRWREMVNRSGLGLSLRGSA